MIAEFDYSAPAELFPTDVKGFRRSFVAYKRFDSAAEAIKYAIEELSSSSLAGTILEVGEARFGVADLKLLYASTSYPLERAGFRNHRLPKQTSGENDN